MKLKALLLTTFALMLASCEPIRLTGQLKVQDKIVLKSKGAWGKRSTVTVSPGTFNNASLVFKNGAIDLVIPYNGKQAKVTMRGKSLDIPRRSGSFNIPGGKIGQSYDVKGSVDYQEDTDGRVLHGTRACTVEKMVKVCDARCGEKRCCKVSEVLTGVEDYAYEIINYSRNVSVRFTKGNSTKASFKGYGSGSFERELYMVNDCRTYGHHRW